jgi:hypothetical protein
MQHAQAQAIVPISLHVWKFWFTLLGMPKFLTGILLGTMVFTVQFTKFQQRCSNNQKFKTFSIIHKLAQELNKKREFFF